MELTQEHKEEIKRAADRIRKYGWVQNDLGNSSIGFCLVGAFCIDDNGVTTIPNNWDTIRNLVIDKVRKPNNWVGIYSPVFWNNEPGRTKEEVLALLDELAS